MEKKITKQQAKKLCIKKWEWIVKNGKKYYGNWELWELWKLEKSLVNAIPELINLNYNCAYCEKYDDDYDVPDCYKCPLKKIEGYSCNEKKSNYAKWDNKPTTKLAKKILENIKKS